jgi:hypothetical protein
MVYTFHFSSSKCSLFHNSNVFCSCIIHILYTGCAKIKKNNSDARRLIHKFLFYNKFIIRLYMFRALCAHHQEVKIVLYSIWYHHTCRWLSGAQVLSPTYYKTRICALSWLITKIMVTNTSSPKDYFSVLFLSLNYTYLAFYCFCF